MSDKVPSPRGPMIKMEPQIVGESGDVKDDPEEMRIVGVRERKNNVNITISKGERKKKVS